MAAAVAASLHRGRAVEQQSLAAEAAVQLVVAASVAPQLRCLAAAFSAGLAGASGAVCRQAARSAAGEVVRDTAWEVPRREARHVRGSELVARRPWHTWPSWRRPWLVKKQASGSK